MLLLHLKVCLRGPKPLLCCHSASAGTSACCLCAGANAGRFASAHQNQALEPGRKYYGNAAGDQQRWAAAHARVPSLCSVVDKTVCVVLQAHHAKKAVQKVGAAAAAAASQTRKN